MTYIRKTADILISDEIREVLKRFEHKSLVAKLLLKTRHPKDYLVDDFVNYISISKTDATKVSYLSADRAEKIDPSEYWTTSRRFIAKPGSFIGKVFKDIPAKEVELFSNIFRLQSEQEAFKLKVVSGNDIKKWYHHENYKSHASSLGNSCMKHDSCQNFFNIYTENPEVCKMLVLVDNNDMLIGRSLLWEFGENKVMDRIYTINDDKYQHQFKEWADANGFIYKKEQKWNNSLWFESKGQPILRELTFDLPNFDPDWALPYMDTFKFGNIKTGKLHNYMPESHRNLRTLIGSGGDVYDWDALAKDDLDNIFYHRNETRLLEYCGLRVHNDHLKYSESNDKYILPEHAVWMEQVRDWIFNEEFNHLNDTNAIERRAKRFEERGSSKSSLPDYFGSLFGSWVYDENVSENLTENLPGVIVPSVE